MSPLSGSTTPKKRAKTGISVRLFYKNISKTPTNGTIRPRIAVMNVNF
jgi:hypothetical protein